MATKNMATKKKTTAETEVTAVKTETKTTKAAKAPKAKATTVTVEFQFQGKNTAVNALVEAVKAAYKADGNEDAVESVALYVQPENGVDYYVVNGKSEGKCVSL